MNRLAAPHPVGRELILLGTTATGLLVLLPRSAFGTSRARAALMMAAVRPTLPTPVPRRRPDRRGRWTRRS